MADSPSHQLGELIGNFLEQSIINALAPEVLNLRHYLDYKHPRQARNFKHEVTHADAQGNEHKLDIVIEENGSEAVLGTPKAFIEVAWRRYTKHSKNKVQEISGAILPIIKRYHEQMPFYAAVLAGEFTDNSLHQLISQGFFVLYFPYNKICEVFDGVGISIRWEEDTPDNVLANICGQLQALSQQEMANIRRDFINRNMNEITRLIQTIRARIERKILDIIVLPLHGFEQQQFTVDDAINYITNYHINQIPPVKHYHVCIRYSTGEIYNYLFNTANEAIAFLTTLKTVL